LLDTEGFLLTPTSDCESQATIDVMANDENKPTVPEPLIAYDLSEWQEWLLPVIFPAAIRESAVPNETASDILQRIPADFGGTFAFHIDLTFAASCPHRRGDLLLRLAQRGIRTLNADILDISKRFVQAACWRAALNTTSTTRGGDPNEVLIVKTNLNCGGTQEADLPAATREALLIPYVHAHREVDHRYLVLKRAEVPEGAWDADDLVVERYISNSQEVFYRAYLLCNRYAILEFWDKEAVKTLDHDQAECLRIVLFTVNSRGKPHGEIPRDLWSAADAVVRFAWATRMEFGCLDLARDNEGHFYITDMNSTPHGAETDPSIITHLSHYPSVYCGSRR
jgi:hypothetical protein